MNYTAAAKHFSKAVEDMVGGDSLTSEDVMKSWRRIDSEIQRVFMSDLTAMDNLALMTDGFIMGLQDVTKQASSLPDGADQDRQIRLLYFELITTAIIRAFAIGAHCQKAADEVELLNSLVEQ
jgi:hypothetical protein